ncbi:MAG: DUF3347 domain-containing protein [Bacteroidota bacterium]|nr:DUF3347 domain-containing protein [Bacteroidota bacterium]
MKIKILFSITLLSGILILPACGEQKNKVENTENVAEKSDTTNDDIMPRMHEGNTESMWDAYVDIKNALAWDSMSLAASEAKHLSKLTMTTQQNKLKNVANWDKNQKLIIEHTDAIAVAKDIKEQRKHFEMLSQAFATTIKDNGLIHEAAYTQFCPMANDGKGANWIAEDSVIRNPYFGAEMRNCGEVQGNKF